MSSLARRPRRHSRASFAAACLEALEPRQLLTFGVSTGSISSPSNSTLVVDNGGNLKFSIVTGGTITSTLHMGDLASIKYKNQEMLAAYNSPGPQRYSHYEQGFSSTTQITSTVDNVNGIIVVKCDDTISGSGSAIQYYIVRKNDDNIYLASLPTDVTAGPGEARYIAYLSRSVFTTPEAPSDNLGNDGAVEGSDVFHHPDGTTTSKFYNMGRRMIDNIYHGVVGSAGGSPVGAWMFMGNREHGASGPFFKDIDFQSGSAVEIYNCLFSGHVQTEPFRQGLHTFALQFTNGSLPTTPDYTWLGSLNLQGWIPASQRGTLTGNAGGVPAGHEVTVGLANATEQYWGTPDASGNYTITGIHAGTYTQTLYDGELEVGTKTVTITAGGTTNSNIIDTFYIPSSPIFRIGTWDGTPIGFLNTDVYDAPSGARRIEIMHPSDVRMNSWTGTPNFTIGTNTDDQWPMTQWKDVNGTERITFNLTAAQVQNLTLRIGITLGFEGGRDRITVNSGQTYAYTSSIPSASHDFNERGVTRGTWHGLNQFYTYSIPSSALRAGTNTLDLTVVSGTAGTGFLSPNVTYDAIDLVLASAATAPAISNVTITPANSTVNVNSAKAFTAVARDASNNVVPANIDWSATRGVIDPNGNYIAPATEGSDTISAIATATRTAGYTSTSANATGTITGSTTGSTTTGLTVLGPLPMIITAAGATPNPAFAGTTTLSVVANDDGGEANLKYTWSLVGTPPGPVTFSANGTNAAKTTNATFTTQGAYSFLVTVTDLDNNSRTSSVSVNYTTDVAWYKNDIAAGPNLPDSFGNNLNATLIGTSYSIVGGVSGSAIQFTGTTASSSSATVPNGILNGVGSFTIAAWVKPTSLNTWARIFDFGTGTTNYMFLTTQGSTNVPRFAIRTPSVAEQFINANTSLSTTSWNHVAVTMSLNSGPTTTYTGTIYINGVSAGSGTFTISASSLGVTTQNYIGDSQFSGDPYYLGAFDDFRIYARALSTNEIVTIYRGGVSGQTFHDVNGNGVFDAGEPTLAGVTVYVDTNNNSALDAGEPSAVSDGSGNYTIASVPAGSYTLRESAVPATYVSSATQGVIISNGVTTTSVNMPNAKIVYTAAAGSNDSYVLRKNVSGKYEILIGGSLAYTLFSGAPSLTFNLGDGNDALDVDYTNGAPIPAGGVSFDGGSAGADSLNVTGQSAATAYNVTATQITGGGSLSYAGVESLSLATGSFTATNDLGSIDLATAADASLALNATQHLDSLTLAGPATIPTNAAAVLVTHSLVIDGGSLDLANNALVIDYTNASPLGSWTGSAYTGISGYLASGRNGGSWNGAGINTSMTDAKTPGSLTSLAVGEASTILNLTDTLTAVWNGQTVDATAVLVKYTYTGDADMNGKLNGDDYFLIDSHVNLANANTWIHGDFDYNGVLNGDDYFLIDQAFPQQGLPL